MNTKTLSEKAMLVSLSISVWDRYKFDRKVTDEVAVNHNTTRKAGRYNKNLLPFDPPTYKAVTALAGEARQAHYAHTLPWRDDGARILPSANWTKYTDTMRAIQIRFNVAVGDFIADSPALFTMALRELNGLGNANDFPSQAQLQGAFGFDVKFFPFPSADDFRVSLQPSDVAAIQAEIESNVSATIAQAMKEPFKRLHEAVKRMATTLADTDAIFRDTMVTNIEGLLEVLPGLNLTGDAQLTAICDEIKAELVVNPDTLRHSTVTRTSIAAKAAMIQANLAGYMA
jgi:hypothetical protein